MEDQHGITEIFAKHLALSLESMHPTAAAQAASQAVGQYLASHDFIDLRAKSSDAPSFKMVPKRTQGKRE